jgi:MarR family transcriptional regulator, organic hydroperoxide resistance regulator
MTKAPALNLDGFLCFEVYSANHAFNRVYQPLLDKLHLTYPQYLVMVLLWERDGQTVGELGARLSLESNTLTPLLKRLETLGYIKRSRDPADERQVRARLTASGRTLRAKALHIPGCILAATGLDAKAAKQLMTGIATLRRMLESYNPK